MHNKGCFAPIIAAIAVIIGYILVLRYASGDMKMLCTFALIPERNASSPLDVPSIKANITTPEIVYIVREGRER